MAQTTRLEREIEAILRGAGLRGGDASVVVVSPSGAVVADLRADEPFKPASNMKILTTLAAIDALGADYEYETTLTTTAAIANGGVQGDVVLWGTGDPNISGRFYDDQPLALIRKWGRQLVAAGIREVRGDLLVDDRFFDDERFLGSWRPGQAGRWFSAEVSSLNLNDNCVDIRIHPSGNVGGLARVEVVPASPFIDQVGAPTTTTGRRSEVVIHRKPGTNEISVRGRIGRDVRNWFDHVAIHDPALFFAHSLVAVFADEGLEIRGEVRRVPRTPAGEGGAGAEGASGDGAGEDGADGETFTPASADVAGDGDGTTAPGAAERGAGAPVQGPMRARRPGQERPTGRLLVRHVSALSIDLPVINKRSQNLHAEVLLKTLGARIEGEGSVEAGGRVIRRFLAERDIDASALRVADGSGLSHENRVTTRMLASALHAARSESWAEVFRSSLAVPGEEGSLDDRFPTHAALRERVSAKSGYISGVSALSGYLRLASGRYASFSLLFSRLPGGNSRIKRVQEDIVAAIDRWGDL